MNNEKGMLIVISAPSGCGKSEIRKRLIDRNENIVYSISATTRKPREGEQDGVDYFFISPEEFMEKVDNDDFLEYARYGNNSYGTLKDYVFGQMAEGKDVILEIEVDGAMQVRKSYPGAVLIFILPPSIAELRRRLDGRGTETEEEKEIRTKAALKEIPAAYQYDYIIVNDDLDVAVSDLETVIEGERHVTGRMINKIDEVLENA